MSKAEDSSEGLAALFTDVLFEGAPNPELLVRYADDPSALPLEERQMVERLMAESPQVRDQLKVLKSFELPAEQPSAAKSKSWLTGALGQIRRLFNSTPLLVGAPAIAVAAIALLLIYPREAADPWAPAFSTDVAVLGQTDVVLDVAMPTYRAPQGAALRLRSSGGGTLQGELRYIPRSFDIIALAPKHVGQTASEAPSLYWYLPEIPEGGVFEFWIGAEGPGAVPDGSSGTGEMRSAWVEKDLPAPSRPGLQRIRLSDYGVRLEAGVDYSWTVSFGLVVHASGWIERVELPAALAGRLAEAKPGQAPASYAEAGLWYDALSSLQELITAHPNDEGLMAARWELLGQAGLGEVAAALASSDQAERQPELREAAPP